MSGGRVCRDEVIPSPKDLVDAIREQVNSAGLTLILEPGRSLIGNAGALLNTGALSLLIAAPPPPPPQPHPLNPTPTCMGGPCCPPAACAVGTQCTVGMQVKRITCKFWSVRSVFQSRLQVSVILLRGSDSLAWCCTGCPSNVHLYTSSDTISAMS